MKHEGIETKSLCHCISMLQGFAKFGDIEALCCPFLTETQTGNLLQDGP
jgi:hypothetical protein